MTHSLCWGWQTCCMELKLGQGLVFLRTAVAIAMLGLQDSVHHRWSEGQPELCSSYMFCTDRRRKKSHIRFLECGRKKTKNRKKLMNELENCWHFPCQVIDYHVKTPLKTDFVFKPAQKSYSHWSLSDWIIFFLVTVPGGSKNQGYWNWEVSPSLTQRHFSHLCK